MVSIRRNRRGIPYSGRHAGVPSRRVISRRLTHREPAKISEIRRRIAVRGGVGMTNRDRARIDDYNKPFAVARRKSEAAAAKRIGDRNKANRARKDAKKKRLLDEGRASEARREKRANETMQRLTAGRNRSSGAWRAPSLGGRMRRSRYSSSYTPGG
jgi:hypothetical protein